MNLNIDNLTDIFSLYTSGLIVGGLLTGIPFIIGLGINLLINTFKK